jgi:hypothetical protein
MHVFVEFCLANFNTRQVSLVQQELVILTEYFEFVPVIFVEFLLLNP